MSYRKKIPRRSSTAAIAAVLSSAVALVFATRLSVNAASSCEFENVDRIVAVGDVHGAYDRFIEILRVTDLIDEKMKWAGGKTHLVQLGDVVDRGPDSRKALDF